MLFLSDESALCIVSGVMSVVKTVVDVSGDSNVSIVVVSLNLS